MTASTDPWDSDDMIGWFCIQGFFMDRNDIHFHGRDERLGVESFYKGQAFLYESVKRLSSAGK